jgi:hypothetical protein
MTLGDHSPDSIGQREKFDRAPIDVELLKTQHDRDIGRTSWRFRLIDHLDVRVHVHVHGDDHGAITAT